MFNFKEQPYHLLLLTALITLATSFFLPNQALDIHLHDTYFVITIPVLFWGTTILFLILWIFNLLTKKLLYSNVLIWTHVILTILPLLLFLSIPFCSDYNKMPGRHSNYNDWQSYNSYTNLTREVLIIFIVIAAGSLAYIINLIIGLFKYITRT